jgi:hypothetical protein
MAWREELEKIIEDLIHRKYAAAPEDSAERRFYERQLTRLRYTFEEADPTMEDLDPAVANPASRNDFYITACQVNKNWGFVR